MTLTQIIDQTNLKCEKEKTENKLFERIRKFQSRNEEKQINLILLSFRLKLKQRKK